MESSPPPSESNVDLSGSKESINDQEPNSLLAASGELNSEDTTSITLMTVEKDSGSSSTESQTIRSSMGGVMHSVSDVINNNLIAARFGVMASVILLSAYGLSNTPLFFRFRTIHDIPSSYFVRRKRLYGRIIEVDKNSSLSSPDGSIYVYVRHLSPVGQVMPKSWFEFFRRKNTTAIASTTAVSATRDGVERKRDLLRVKIAGVQYPPYTHFRYKTEEYLEVLARDRTLVSCQLLARQVPKAAQSAFEENGSLPPRSKRSMHDAFPELQAHLNEEERRKQQFYDGDSSIYATEEESMGAHLGVCKLSYRPTLFQFFPTDIAVSLLLSGNASVSSTLLASKQETKDEYDDDSSTPSTSTAIVDHSQRLDDLQDDVKYLERLTQVEYEAVKNEAGIWAFAEVRETKSDVLAEIEFQANANFMQKLWRRLRGG